MSSAVILPGPGPAIPEFSFTAIAAVNILPGQPVAISQTTPGEVALCSAQASFGKLHLCAGLCANQAPVAAGQPVLVQYGGILSLTLAQWEAVIDTGGLVTGDGYFVSTTDGILTATAPTGFSPVTPVLIAKSGTDVLLQISIPVTT